MAYNIYLLVAVVDTKLSCALRCNSYTKSGYEVMAYEVMEDGTEKKHNWGADYLQISHEAAIAAQKALQAERVGNR